MPSDVQQEQVWQAFDWPYLALVPVLLFHGVAAISYLIQTRWKVEVFGFAAVGLLGGLGCLLWGVLRRRRRARLTASHAPSLVVVHDPEPREVHWDLLAPALWNPKRLLCIAAIAFLGLIAVHSLSTSSSTRTSDWVQAAVVGTSLLLLLLSESWKYFSTIRVTLPTPGKWGTRYAILRKRDVRRLQPGLV